jgi:hypothetical protein
MSLRNWQRSGAGGGGTRRLVCAPLLYHRDIETSSVKIVRDIAQLKPNATATQAMTKTFSKDTTV